LEEIQAKSAIKKSISEKDYMLANACSALAIHIKKTLTLTNYIIPQNRSLIQDRQTKPPPSKKKKETPIKKNITKISQYLN